MSTDETNEKKLLWKIQIKMMTNNVRDTDDGRVWGSSHCLLRKERIWRGGSKTFLLNIFLNIFALSNFTHNSTLFFL